MTSRFLSRAIVSLTLTFAIAIGSAHAADVSDARAKLDAFFSQTRTLSADFQQTLLDANGSIVELASGAMAISKPNQFRWHYRSPDEQIIVADGERLWLFDVELDQVTVQDQGAGLSGTPATLLSGGPDAFEAFTIEASYKLEALTWIELSPKNDDADFTGVSLGFEDDVLVRMQLRDRLKQKTDITFSKMTTNADLDASQFEFTVPEGVDVIDSMMAITPVSGD